MKRNLFSLSSSKLYTCDMGELVPCGLIEVLPGDTMQQNTTLFMRASPLLSPVMHPVDVRIHHWFVPHRLLWEDWEDFITGGPDGMDASSFPTIDGGESGFALGSLGDYLGIPTGVADLSVSALPFRAYALIWNEWYRDQDLQTPLVLSEASGVDSTTNTALQNCCWEKDYLTSARPWEQKGPAITVPIGEKAYVKGIAKENQVWDGAGNLEVYESGGEAATTYTAAGGHQRISPTDSDGQMQVQQDPDNPGFPNIYADLSGASLVTVNALREAMALQRYEEARARYGSRYVEYLRYLGVRSSDARLQRPEFLGGGRNVFQWSEVLQTAEGTNAVGTLRGHGIAAGRSNRYRRHFEEHGYVLTLASVRPKTIYAQGLARTWNRRIKEDFWQQELQHIGQQEVLNKEVYAAHASPDETFGFQDRYDEYRRQESSIAADFRTTLNFWHFARQFGSSPALNGDFVKCVPTEVPFAVSTNDVLWCYAKHSVQSRRLVSRTGSSFIY